MGYGVIEDIESNIDGLAESKPAEGKKEENLKIELLPKDVSKESIFHGFKKEMKEISKLSFPVALTNTLQFMTLAVSLMMSGRLRKEEMDAVSLGNSMINAFGLSIGVGLCTACDTLFSQSFGSSDTKQTGIWLQKGLLIINAFAFFVIAVHLNFEPILIAIGQNPEIARLTGKYMCLFTPGIVFQWNYLIFARYLQIQETETLDLFISPEDGQIVNMMKTALNMMKANVVEAFQGVERKVFESLKTRVVANKIYVPMVAGFFGITFNASSQYILIYVMDFGYEMCALCQMGTYGLMLSVELIYILSTKFYVPTWNGWKREAFAEWSQFVSLALAGIGHVTLEAVSWEIGTFVSGYLGKTELAVQSILYQTETILYMMSFGISIAVNIRVGQNLGGNNYMKAKRSLMAGWVACLISGLFAAIISITCKNYLPMVFTNHTDVIESTSKILPLMGVFLLIDSVHIVNAGALRGCGRQRIGAIFIFVGFYVIGEPIGISMALLTDMGVVCLWIGVLIGLSIITVLEIITILRQDWKEQAKLAMARLSMSQTHNSGTREERKSLILKRKFRKRHPTACEPRGCSMDFANIKIKLGISRERFLRLLRGKIAVYVFALIFLLVGLFIHLYVPTELYRPKDEKEILKIMNGTGVHNLTEI